MISFYKGNKTLKLFYSYSSDTYLEDKFTFPKDRKMFLNNYLNLTKYFYDKEFERLKSLDTIYLFIERGENMRYIVDIDNAKNKRQENYFFDFKCSSGQFTNLNRFSSTEPANVFYEKESFLKTNSDKIVHFEDLLRFTQCDLEQLIGSKTKKFLSLIKMRLTVGQLKLRKSKVELIVS